MSNDQGCCSTLLVILTQARELLAAPENDFSWSGWHDSEQALSEIDGYLATLQAGKLPPVSQLNMLFLPTGPLQEVSISSGWGEKFLALARSFDHAIAKCA